tara:strand:+ start:146 stop:292 length:147 start_codon:yes stop_codon:yes gene_type:complete
MKWYTNAFFVTASKEYSFLFNEYERLSGEDFFCADDIEIRRNASAIGY